MSKEKLFQIDWDFEPYKSIKKLLDNSDKAYATAWAAICAQGVLKFFEEKFPNDMGPRNAIDEALKWSLGNSTIAKAKKAASIAQESARNCGENFEAELAARCAGHAAATAYAKDHAYVCLQYALTINK